MSLVLVLVLVAGYLCFLVFVIALLTAAKRGDEAMERERMLAEPLFTRDDVEFLEHLDLRA